MLNVIKRRKSSQKSGFLTHSKTEVFFGKNQDMVPQPERLPDYTPPENPERR